MRKILVKTLSVVVVLIVGLHNIGAQNSIDAYFYSIPYYSYNNGIYLETYLTINGNNLNYIKGSNGLKQASLEVTMLFKNGDDIKEYRKYNLKSPLYNFSITEFQSFTDIQKIYLPEGVYSFDLIVEDLNGAKELKDYRLSTYVVADIALNKMSLSGIQFLKDYFPTQDKNIRVRDGNECVPFETNIFSSSENIIKFYSELYWASNGFQPLEDFAVRCYIEEVHTGKRFSDMSYFSTDKARNKNVISGSVDIKRLPTGKYYFVCEILTMKDKPVLVKKRYFERINTNVKLPMTNYNISAYGKFTDSFSNDSLVKVMGLLKPISNKYELSYIDSLVKSGGYNSMKKFLYAFWKARNEKSAEQAYEDYMAKVIIVNNMFATESKHGIETDKGRVYLMYGAPNSVIDKYADKSAYPYEVWHYYSIEDQYDVKFIFYKLDSSYKLLHSNMKADINNSDWLNILYKGNVPATPEVLQYFNRN